MFADLPGRHSDSPFKNHSWERSKCKSRSSDTHTPRMIRCETLHISFSSCHDKLFPAPLAPQTPSLVKSLPHRSCVRNPARCSSRGWACWLAAAPNSAGPALTPRLGARLGFEEQATRSEALQG